MAKKICVLEDNDDIRELIEMVFEAEAFDVVSFSTVTEFTAKVPSVQPDVFLLDVMLPDGNGLEVCRKLREDEATTHIPIVIMTANSRMDKMMENCDADDFIAKPFDIDDLAKRIHKQINKN